VKAELFDTVMDSPVGHLGICLQGARVCGIAFLTARRALRPPASADSRRVVAALETYFAGTGQMPHLDVAFSGTDFQQRVWRALQTIPAGQVVTYGALAERLGSSARAVGNACRHNPVPILLPCHRVVAVRGLGGFAGDTSGRLLEIKRHLLVHEGVEIAALRPHMSS
jgi:methylated-DNA-[protein]-cysteine S-methyltransferase